MDDEMPAVANKHCRSSSLRVRTFFWMRADASPSLTILRILCISEHLIFMVLEQADVVCCLALVTCMNVIG